MRALTLSMDQSIYEFTVSYLEAAAILDVVQWEEVGHYGVGGVSMKGSFDPSSSPRLSWWFLVSMR